MSGRPSPRAARATRSFGAQDDERDRVYLDPAVRQGKAHGLRVPGRFASCDAIVMHGDGVDLNPPLDWNVHGDNHHIGRRPRRGRELVHRAARTLDSFPGRPAA